MPLIAFIIWDFVVSVASATSEICCFNWSTPLWDLCRFSWSPQLRQMLSRFSYTGLVITSAYMGPLLPELVALIWSPQMCGILVAAALHLNLDRPPLRATFVATVDCVRYMGLFSPKLIALRYVGYLLF